METTTQNETELKGIHAVPSAWLRPKVVLLNNAFNSLSITIRRRMAIGCGIVTSATALMFIIQPFYSEQEKMPAIETISVPLDIYQYNEMEQHNAKTLAPIGKMKGEIDGTFEAFYIAVDNEGILFINRDPAYGNERFLKTNGWEAITNEEFSRYEKQLHFVPHNNRKGLTP